jgi:hypothetical protein
MSGRMKLKGLTDRKDMINTFLNSHRLDATAFTRRLCCLAYQTRPIGQGRKRTKPVYGHSLRA